jgi:hypothetical protein
MMIVIAATLMMSSAASALAVGDIVTNPVTGATETVVTLLGNGSVLTSANNVIIVPPFLL